MSFVSAVSDIICEDYLLENSSGRFKIIENSSLSRSTPIEVGGCRSLGFSLDKARLQPWGFLKATLPSGFARKCDGIIAAEYEGEAYAIFIELKSSPTKCADKQIHQSMYFFDWIVKNLTACGHWHGTYKTIGVICLPARRQASKRTTSRSFPVPRITHRDGYPIFDLTNRPYICIPELIKASP